jgi:hypothetical protein
MSGNALTDSDELVSQMIRDVLVMLAEWKLVKQMLQARRPKIAELPRPERPYPNGRATATERGDRLGWRAPVSRSVAMRSINELPVEWSRRADLREPKRDAGGS